MVAGGRRLAGRREPRSGPFSVALSTWIRFRCPFAVPAGSRLLFTPDRTGGAGCCRRHRTVRRSLRGSRRWISARPRWCAACGCRTRTGRAAGCRMEARRSLARQFCLVAQHHLLRGDSLLEITRKRIEERIAEVYGDRIPGKYKAVRGYTSVQPILLQYLSQHVGNPVRSSKLRVLTADQTHTERRVRDLRELGFDVEWKKVSDDDQYVLASIEPDLDKAAAQQVRKNIREDKKLSKTEKDYLLALLSRAPHA